MRRKSRLHKPEFKVKVALEAIKGEMTMAEMVRKFDVQATQITQWKKQLQANAGGVFDKGEMAADETPKTVQELLHISAKMTACFGHRDRSAHRRSTGVCFLL